MGNVKVGVIGLGMGRNHLQNYEQCPDADVVALCDIDETRLAAATEGRPDVRAFTDYREMLAMDGLDAVSVALPTFLHAPVTIEALKAGKHVMCEKPMAMSVAEAEAMRATADEVGRKLMIHYNVRWFVCGFTLKPILDAGLVGEVYHVTTTYLRRRGYPGPGTWFGQKDKSGGGPMMDLGVHRLDFALWLVGYANPVWVAGNTYDLLARERMNGLKYDCEDFATGMVRFDNGMTLYISASWDGHEPFGGGLTMSIRGSRGAIFEEKGQWTLCREEAGVNTVTQLEPAKAIETPQDHFVRCIREDTPPEPSAEHGIICMKILEGLYRSAETGRPVELG